MGAEFIVTLIVALFILLIAMCIGTAFTTPFHGAVIRSVDYVVLRCPETIG